MQPNRNMGRWRKFSLRALLGLVLLFAILFAVVAKRLQKAKVQRRAVAKIVEGGGMVFYSYHVDASGKARVDRAGKLLQPDGITDGVRRLFGDDIAADVVGAYVNVHASDDAVWDHLSKLKSLRNLSISGNSITDMHLERLEELDHLRVLEVGSVNVTEARLSRLKEALPRCDVFR